MKPYENRFEVGEQVRVIDREQLEDFKSTWEYHHPVTTSQLEYAGQVFQVESVSFYHGGDVLYQLKGVPDIWHEVCLAPADATNRP